MEYKEETEVLLCYYANESECIKYIEMSTDYVNEITNGSYAQKKEHILMCSKSVLDFRANPLDGSCHSGVTYDRNVVPVPTTEEVYTQKLEREYSCMKFAPESAQPDLARVKLLLSNSSKRLVEWVIKSVNENIQAIPQAFGLIKPFDTEKCTLIWRRPKEYNSWFKVPPLKMKLQIKLMVSRTGKVIGEASSRFWAVVDPNAACTAEEPPFHNIILNSEPGTMVLKKRKPKEKTDANSEMQEKIENENFLDDSQRNYWILIPLYGLLTTLLLKLLFD